MGIDTRITLTVDRVFKKYTELTVPVIFNKSDVSGFDFGTGENVSTSTTINTTGFIIESKSKIDGRISSVLILIVKTLESDFSGYTTVSINGDTYSCKLKTGNKYTTEFEVVKQ